MNWSTIHNIMGWIMSILGVVTLIRFPILSLEGLLGFISFVWGCNLWLESRVDKIEERFMID